MDFSGGGLGFQYAARQKKIKSLNELQTTAHRCIRSSPRSPAMPAQLTNGSVSKKRKRMSAVEKIRKGAESKVAKLALKTPTAEDVLELEEAIVESPQNYNKIVTLLEYVQVCSPGLSGYLGVCSSDYISNCRTRPRVRSWQ